ncbi:helix-turn-helix transcriptional regulator [Nonomuraea rosea]|uniref:helix-turn-helix transcriptional regulator n=1 Tax=Nonomuraea rosea TaxID=638574 RepID=UPI0031ED1E76
MGGRLLVCAVVHSPSGEIAGATVSTLPGPGATVADQHGTAVLPALARHGHLSVRSLRRRFEELLGTAPSEWLRRERLQLAQRLLESGDEAVEQVAERAGYPSAAAMRAEFARRLLISPRQYRRTFRERRRTG